MSNYIRKTRDVFVVQTNYGYGHGWEDTAYEETRKAARDQLRCYRDNQPEYLHRLITRWEEIEV